MSETLNQDPDGLVGASYTTIAPSYPPTPATPSSTVQEAPPGANLPPFSTFSNDMDSSGTFSSVSDRLFSDTRLLDISNWDYYTETRLLERGENGLSIISSQPQYRPWESKSVDATSAFAATTQINTFADAFAAQQNGASKLPSFQSQFQSFTDPVTTSEPTLTTLTNLTPVSPNSSSPHTQSLTTLNSSFHTLSSVNPRGYPLVPAPIQAREIPSIQQQFLDERHIQLYSHPINNTIHSASIFPAQNGAAIIQNNQLISSPTVVTVIKSEPDLKLTTNLATDTGIKVQNIGLHPTQFQNPMPALHNNSDTGLYNGIEKKVNGTNMNMTSPTRNDFRKKERRKIRASSLESSAESDGASSNMDMGAENSGQVAAVSSTDGFKTHPMDVGGGMQHEISGGTVDKQVKKKRKRCGECIGCQRKDNCGDCAPCRNDKSHQICKQRRCEKLTEKKNLYGEPYMRGESRRGRGKGRGGASYRGRKPSGPIAPLSNATSIPAPPDVSGATSGPSQQPTSRPSPQPTSVQQSMPVQQNPMTPMPFYADPNRFTTPVWQADPAQGWTQGQFIQQLPPSAQPIETYQQYPGGIYQATYQQPTFETNTFYTGAVQVLTNARPPSVPNQPTQMVPARPNSNYAHTPSPSPAQQGQVQQQQQQQQQQQTNGNRQYQEYTQFSGNTSNTETNSSRPSSVNSVVNQNPATPTQNFSQQTQQQGNTAFTSVSSADFSPNSTSTQYINPNSGNAEPGYPQVTTNSPQVVSHSSSGYPGNEEYGGQPQQQQWQQEQHIMWEHQDNKMEQNYHQEQNSQEHYMSQQQETTSPNKMHNDSIQNTSKPFSQADKVNLNSRIKTMILNKQQNENKTEDVKPVDQNATGHFLWYSHHHHLKKSGVDGGPLKPNQTTYSKSTDDFNNTQMFAQNDFLVPKNEARQLDNNAHIRNKKDLYDQNLRNVNKERPTEPWIVNHIQKSIKIEENTSIVEQDFSKKTSMHWNEHNESQEKNPSIFCKSEYDNTSPDTKNQFARQNYPQNIKCENDVKYSSSWKQLSDEHLQETTPPKQTFYTGNFHTPPKCRPDEKEFRLFTPPSPKTDQKKYGLGNLNLLTPPKTPEKQQYLFPESRSKSRLNDKPSPAGKIGEEIPMCRCFPPNEIHSEPGTYYTHLGCANDLKTLRHNLECQTGQTGAAIRIEKISYTGKEGKTAQGCPIAKWIIRRVSLEEKYLVLVKHRKGHSCHSAFIIVGFVVWEGVTRSTADDLYSTLTEKLNKFGLPTKRRCATNELRTCACQGVNEETCGASFSFGCSWSMYYNGCKFTRSKEVRKFRLSIKDEELEVEKKLQDLADHISPMYRSLAPQSFKNQCLFENIASDCRLGFGAGRPFSGVTACMDFCAHAHKDIQNMINGCTVVVTLTKHRGLEKPSEEQLHVLPMYVLDTMDDYGLEQTQMEKISRGQIEVLNKYPCEVRTCSIPTPSCRKMRKNSEDQQRKKKQSTSQPSSPSISSTTSLNSPVEQSFRQNLEIQNGQVSSTVLDNPNNTFRYDQFFRNSPHLRETNSYLPDVSATNQLPHFSVFKNYLSYNNYPYNGYPEVFSNHYSQTGFLKNDTQQCYFNNYPYNSIVQNPFFQPPVQQVTNSYNASFSTTWPPNKKEKVIDIKYSDNAECFKDSEIGGVAIALPHGSVLFECAKHELHATTALKQPDRRSPTRISLVFYQHRNMNKHQHGLDEYTLKLKRKLEGDKEGDLDNFSSFESNHFIVKEAVDIIPKVTTVPTVSWKTTFPMYPCMVTGPYQEYPQGSFQQPQ